MEIKVVSHISENWSTCMLPEDAKKFVDLFPKDTFVIATILVDSFEEALASWDKSIKQL